LREVVEGTLFVAHPPHQHGVVLVQRYLHGQQRCEVSGKPQPTYIVPPQSK
jgi:hypothetical protein